MDIIKKINTVKYLNNGLCRFIKIASIINKENQAEPENNQKLKPRHYQLGILI